MARRKKRARREPSESFSYTDPEGNALTLIQTEGALNGSASITKDGRILYEPAADSNGQDVFEYTVADGQGGEEAGEIVVTVTAVNDPPRPRDDAVSTREREAVVFDGRNVVSNAHEARRTAPLPASGVVPHVLPAGSVFNLTTKTLVRQDEVVDPSEEEELAVAGRGLKRLARDIAAGDVSPSLLRRRRARQSPAEGDLA